MKHIYYEDGEFAGKSHWELLENMFRLEEFQHVIEALKHTRCAEYHAYSRDTGTISTSLTKVCPTEIILFDTSMMLDHMDFLILVDVRQDLIIKRKIARDSDVRSPEQIIDMHTRVQGYYWERCKPKDPDIVIDNNDFKNIHIVLGAK
jgi:uridine kinase